MKNRRLSTQPGSVNVAYSRMDSAAQAHLAKALESVHTSQLGYRKTAEFVASMTQLYTELDYAHHFS